MDAMVLFCSVATQHTLPHARVLAHTLRVHHPDARIVVCVPRGDARGGEDFEVLRPGRLIGAGPDEDTGALTLETLPAHLLAWAVAEDAEVAAYVDPRIAVYAPLEPGLAAAREHGLALVRRVHALPDDGRRPDGADLLAAGSVSPAFVVGSGHVGDQFARWWSQGVSRGGAPSRWLEIAPSVFPDAAWLDDPGFNVSFWNLHERPLERRGEQLMAAGEPLRFIDFSGFRADRPYLMSESSTRILPIEDPLLAELCGEYAERLEATGWVPPEPNVTNEQRLGNGLPMDPLLRPLWEEAIAAGVAVGDPASPLAADAFVSWLREPAPQGGTGGVNRYLYGVYASRPDLQAVFPNLEADAQELVAWGWQHGRRELGLIPDLLPPSPDGLGGEDAHLTVNVFGYLRDTLGIGEAARLYITALEAVGVPLTTTAVAPDMPVDPSRGKTIKRFGRRAYQEINAPFEPAFNLVCLNGDHLAAFVRAGGAELLGERLTVGVWGWETDVLPPSWLPGYQFVDEIWVYSTFVAKNLGRLSPVPVIVVPPAIAVPSAAGVDVDLINDDRFTFLFMFDYFSTLQRKNPLGLIEAFKRAFAPGEGPRLLLKTLNEEFRPEPAAELHAAAGDRPDIHLVDRYLEPHEMTALVAKASCYVSLHRSEGFGLTLAEAMSLNTPVVTTAYSGNMDFTSERNSYLVDWTTTTVGQGSEVYPPEGSWAEPDLDHAAELMRRVWENPSEAAQKAARARLDIERQYSPIAAGRVARARLEALLQPRRTGVRAEPFAALKAIEQELALDLRRGVPSRRAASGLLRRGAMRMMLPFTVHERKLDRAVFDALRELRADLDRERARGARARAQLRHVQEWLAAGKEPRS